MLLGSCYQKNREQLFTKDPNVECDTTNLSFKDDIKPIIDSKCATSGCHAEKLPSGYNFDTYEGVTLLIPSGRFMASINHTGPKPMPKDLPKLDECTIAKITAWVNAGAPEN